MSDWHGAELAVVPLVQVAPHPANFRTVLNDLDELAASIARQGLVDPLEVMPADRVAAAWPQHADALAGYVWVVLFGHRRRAASWRAFADDPQATVPVLIRRDAICDDPRRQLDVMITEEVAHRPWNAIEQARAFQAAVAAGRSQREIAERYACAQGHVSRRLSLLRLPNEIQNAVETGQLSVSDALKLSKLGDPDQIRAVWALYVDRGKDAWITTLDKAIATHADRVDFRDRQQGALEAAGAEGLQVIDPVEQFGRELAARRLEAAEEVAAARAAGTLVAAISGHGDLEYFTTSASATTPEPAPVRLDPGQRRAAAAARERAGRRLAGTPPPELPPSAAPMVDSLLRSAPDEWRRLARRWLRWLHVGPGSGVEPAAWWEHVYHADWDTRVWAAHCVTLAECEHRARTHREWDDADRGWLWRLVTDAGYVPYPWERQRLTGAAADPVKPALLAQLPGETPPGWFESYERCDAGLWLTTSSMVRLERDPYHLHEVEQVQRCHLEQGHLLDNGSLRFHAAHVQDADAEQYELQTPTGSIMLWAWWPDNSMEYSISPADPCQASVARSQGPDLDERICLLFAGHPRRHY